MDLESLKVIGIMVLVIATIVVWLQPAKED